MSKIFFWEKPNTYLSNSFDRIEHYQVAIISTKFKFKNLFLNEFQTCNLPTYGSRKNVHHIDQKNNHRWLVSTQPDAFSIWDEEWKLRSFSGEIQEHGDTIQYDGEREDFADRIWLRVFLFFLRLVFFFEADGGDEEVKEHPSENKHGLAFLRFITEL